MSARLMPLLFVLIQTLLTFPAMASPITVGEPFPSITIAEIGECVIDGEDASFQPWDSTSLRGKVRVLEYVAARQGIDAVYRPFFNEVERVGFSSEQFGITRLVNSDDAAWGTSGFVPGEVKKNKLKTPEVSFVIDAEGVTLKQWRLKEKGAALAILDQKGTVLFFKQGPLTDEEINTSIDLIKQHLPSGSN